MNRQLVVASEFWGYDSREKPRSEEHVLAAWGIKWEALDPAAPSPSTRGT